MRISRGTWDRRTEPGSNGWAWGGKKKPSPTVSGQRQSNFPTLRELTGGVGSIFNGRGRFRFAGEVGVHAGKQPRRKTRSQDSMDFYCDLLFVEYGNQTGMAGFVKERFPCEQAGRHNAVGLFVVRTIFIFPEYRAEPAPIKAR